MKFKRLTAVLVTMLIILTGCSSAGEEQPAKEEIIVTLPTDLTDEEMAIWETMPQVVTMRINSERFYSEEFDDKKEILEILFIEKNGAVRCFKWAGHEKFYKDYTVETEFEWAAQKFTEADKYEITGTVDVHKLIDVLNRLVEGGNTVVVIEHNLDVIKQADYIIDLGPDGGDRGGTVVAHGTPEEVAALGTYLHRITENTNSCRHTI